MPPRRRPLWLVAALCVLSTGIYVPLWFGLSWAELRRETANERMQPAWHAVSIFVPGYGSWQVYQHFATIGAALDHAGSTLKIDALSATIGALLWYLTWFHYSAEPIFVLLNAGELLAGTAVVVYGQRALNEYWRARPRPPVSGGLVGRRWVGGRPGAPGFLGGCFLFAGTPPPYHTSPPPHP